MVGGDDERQDLLHGEPQQDQIGGAEVGEAPGFEDAFHVSHAKAGDTEELFARGAVGVDGEGLTVAERPGKLKVEREVEIRVGGGGDFVHIEAVEAEQPARLLERVFADERRGLDGQQR